VVGGPPAEDETVDTRGGASQQALLLAGGMGAVATIMIYGTVGGVGRGVCYAQEKALRFVLSIVLL
jgi:hypothetical protein